MDIRDGCAPTRPAWLNYNDEHMAATPSPTVHTILAQALGRYLVLPSTSGSPAPLLVGFHGYGESAERHLEALQGIPGVEHWRVASVQGLHRFYQTRTEQVVASWMTSQDREQMIRDNLAYVSDVVTALRATGDPDTPLVYAGFSQGVAMAYRAALSTKHTCRGLLALAGDIPPELHDTPAQHWPPILLGHGLNDQWYTQDKWRKDQNILKSRASRFDTVQFDGGHEWHPDFLEAAGRFLDRIREQQIEISAARAPADGSHA